ncbi:uncharacterized protein LOC110703838 [Chenopodium quinoa]|uniref:uncharacterized protein LOC110703838 n=1 Tax=Chenopodium quinoa TaxID=63459 RepID=UPI000B79752B|nr:uncharacterized protein LOC110703838 [Chenopodium quinoa]
MKQVLVNLSDKHKQAIQKIGFGAFLNLDAPHYVDSWLTQQLLSNFDPKRCCLMLPGREEEILFDEIDVHMTYGLPMGDIAILDTIENKNECANFMQKWRKKLSP